MKIIYHRRDVFCQDNNCLIWKAPNFSFYMRKLQFGQRKTPVWTNPNESKLSADDIVAYCLAQQSTKLLRVDAWDA